MKKFLTLFLTLVLCLTSFTIFGCKKEDGVNYTFIAPDGAPAIAISKLINDQNQLSTDKKVEYKVVKAVEIQSHLASGKADLALAPVNLASKLYKAHDKDNPYVMVAVITHGNFYIMSTEQITVNDLAGRQIAVPMQGAVPDWTLKMTLKKHGVTDVTFNYYAEAKDINPLIIAGGESIGLIPEPAATALTKNAQKDGKTIYRLDLQELYDGVEKAYPQAVLMVKKSVINAHPNLVENLENQITESVAWAKENVATAVSAISKICTTTLQAPALSAEVIDRCKIYWQGAQQAKTSVINYINAIIEIDNAKATAVQDNFFYIAQ